MPRRDLPSAGREARGGQRGLQAPVMYSQHTQTVHARDTLAVPQQIAAVQAGGEQELLPRLPADLAVIHSHRVHGRGTGAEKGQRCCCCRNQTRLSHLPPCSARCSEKRKERPNNRMLSTCLTASFSHFSENQLSSLAARLLPQGSIPPSPLCSAPSHAGLGWMDGQRGEDSLSFQGHWKKVLAGCSLCSQCTQTRMPGKCFCPCSLPRKATLT